MIQYDKTLSLQEVERIVFGGEKLALADTALLRLERSFAFLKEFAADKVIYGINT